MNKVFGIGWAKTGTTTLGQCFRQLGFRHQSHRFDLVPDLAKGRLDRIFACVERYDSFEDWPWILLFRELDLRFPGSRFVLTYREPTRWLASYRAHLARIPRITEAQNERRRVLYGLPFPDVSDQQLLERYQRHNQEVRDYFSGRATDLLVANWENGDGWGSLCGFLGCPVPDLPFPHANSAAMKPRRKQGLSLRRLLPRAFH